MPVESLGTNTGVEDDSLQSPQPLQPPEPLQPLTRLLKLRLDMKPEIYKEYHYIYWVPGGDEAYVMRNDMFPAGLVSGAHQLTRLDVSDYCHQDRDKSGEPGRGVLAGKTQLQHLNLQRTYGGIQLLSDLADLQQLTRLELRSSFYATEDGNTSPAAAVAALTASSKLHHLDLESCTLPAGVWQHVFPAGRQLPALRTLHLSEIRQPSGGKAPAPDGSLLVSCCPGLHRLRMGYLSYSAALLVPLQGLNRLHTLWLRPCF